MYAKTSVAYLISLNWRLLQLNLCSVRNSLAVMLARLQEDSSFSIYTQDADILSDGGIDVLLGTGSSGENSGKFFLNSIIVLRIMAIFSIINRIFLYKYYGFAR